MEAKKIVPNFYRRRLPSSCVDFASADGKALFKESLVAGFANIYFKLASQFLTQDEPAYCGLSTLVMVLNALDVDPGKVWKAPWRFYHESMLDCCLPLEVIKRKGITLTQFYCLASCNRLLVDLHYALPTDEFLSSFRENIRRSVTSDDVILVISYDRKALGQTGSGHFSPIGAYNEAADKVLILDVARFKYPPHWVTVPNLHNAMLPVDCDTQRPRGYLMVKLRADTRPLVLFGFRADAGADCESFLACVLEWNAFLAKEKRMDGDEELKAVCDEFGRLFSDFAVCTNETMLACGKTECCMERRMQACCKNICSRVLLTRFGRLMQSPPATALLLSWPLQRNSERSSTLSDEVSKELENFDADSLSELGVLRTQIEAISADALSRRTTQSCN